MKFDERAEAIVGKAGEIAGGALFQHDGASTIALCRIDAGGAPLLERGEVRRNLVLPDLQAFNWRHSSGVVCFLEIKTYAIAPTFRIYGCQVHGIAVRHVNHFARLTVETGIPIYLAINELHSGEMRVSPRPLVEMPTLPCFCRCRSVDLHRHVPSGRGIQEAQWYFRRDDLSIVYRHDTRTITRLRTLHDDNIRPPIESTHAWQKHTTREAPRQTCLFDRDDVDAGTRDPLRRGHR